MKTKIDKFSDFILNFQQNEREIIVIHPTDPIALLASHPGSWGKERLRPDHFAILAYKMACLRKNLYSTLEQGGLIVVLLSPYQYVVHQRHDDLVIGNYDWLWRGAGQDKNLFLSLLGKDSSYTLTEYGLDTPFASYLQLPSLKVEIGAEGKDLYPLAWDSKLRAIAFFLTRGKGKIIFLPKFQNQKEREIFFLFLQEATEPEAWPCLQSFHKIFPDWVSHYSFPETRLLEQILDQKEEEIQRLEQECDYIHKNLLYLDQLRDQLFLGNSMNISAALSCILAQWGVETFLSNDVIQLISGEYSGLVLCAVCEKYAPLWLGKKLQRLLTNTEIKKGILVVNAYRSIDPQKRTQPFYSSSLIRFAEEHNLALTSSWDIFQAHCLGRKELLDFLWERSGVVSWKELLDIE